MKDTMDTLHIKIPRSLKKRVKMNALKADMTMAEWVIQRLKVGVDTRVKQ